MINLQKSVTIKFQDKFKVRYMMESQPLLFHPMLKQGFNWFTLVLILKQKMFKSKKIIITEMAHEISPICDFLFGSIRTNLPSDTADVELTGQMVKGLYTYRKDHTMESMIFTPCSKKVTPFPSLRHMIQAYQNDQRSERVLPWNNGNTFQISAPLMTQNNPRK